jgi:transposase InsO family protein
VCGSCRRRAPSYAARAARGVRIDALMSDNGVAYKSHLYARTLRELGLRHVRIKPGPAS